MRPIFLFSLPRSGSTLVQRVLGAHEKIATASEPWLLLPFFYALRDRGIYAEYNHHGLVAALTDYFARLPGGKADYFVELSGFITRLYRRAAGTDVDYFVDKTPRYHLIADDVMRAFTDAKFIVLWRNPLAIAASMIETWGRGGWNLHEFKIDLFDGLRCLVEAASEHRERLLMVRYEDLVGDDAEREWKRVFAYLGLDFDPALLPASRYTKLEGRMGDPTGVRDQPVSRASVDKWRTIMANPVRKAWCRRYLRQHVGRERLRLMGYDLEGLLRELGSTDSTTRHVVSDVARMAYGLAYCALEPRIFKHKLLAKDWSRVHIHT